MKIIYFLLFTFCFVCCKEENVNLDLQVENEVHQLKTHDQKEAYLTDIFDADQAVRGGNPVMLKLVHGEDSEEYQGYMNKQWDQDDLNLKKVEYFLKEHGHPKAESMNYKALTAIWAVIQHTGIEGRERTFEHMYEAYLKGDADVVWILERMYGMKMRKEFIMPDSSPYDDKVDQMIMELGLEEKKQKVIERMATS